MINFTSSFRAKKSILNDVLKYSSGTALQNLYNIYIYNDVLKIFKQYCFTISI